jgi:hypothetical protein
MTDVTETKLRFESGNLSFSSYAFTPENSG